MNTELVAKRFFLLNGKLLNTINMVRQTQRNHMKLFSKGFILLLFFFLGLVARASVSFYNINDLFGISIRETASTCMDDVGFIWVSSKTGIIRLMEDDYRIYQLPYDSRNVQTVRLIYKSPDLFAYTNNGQVFKYNRVLDRFELVVNIETELNNQFLSVGNLLIDRQNQIWISSSQGLIKYVNGKTVVFNDIGQLLQIVWFDENQLFLASENELVLFDIHAQKIGRKLLDFPDKFSLVSKLYYESTKNILWIGSVSSGLYVYDLVSRSLIYTQGVPNQPVLGMDFINDSTMLIGVDGQGLWEISSLDYSIKNIFKENSDDPNSISGNGVYDIFRDKTERVWICTYSGGVSYFDQKPSFLRQLTHLANNTNSLVNNDVNDVLEDNIGNLWFATNNGISRWNIQTNKWQSLYHNKEEQAQVFLSLCEDISGNIWAGTYSSGVYVIDGMSGREIIHYSGVGDDAPFNNIFIFDIIKDKDDNIWIAGMNGDVVCYNYREKRFINYGRNPVSVIREWSSEKMILGCPYGISELNRKTSEVNILLNGYLIQDMVVLDNEIWMGTIGDGLLSFNRYTGRVEIFNMEDGLPSNYVNSVFNHDGFLWLGTENGICKFNPVDQTVETFPEISTLSKASFNRGAHFRKKDGGIIWGTNRGAVVFDPSSILQSQPQGKIFIQDIRILDQSLRSGVTNILTAPVDSLKSLCLKHNQNAFYMEMLPLGMSSGARFSWFLEGFDTEWSRPANNRNLNYTNLPTGEFTLKVRMYDNSLSEIIDERSLIIVKKPPFWETWWFLLIVTIVLFATFYFSSKYYINLIKQLHSEEKFRFFANTAHEMRTSLTLIKAPIEEISNEKGLSDKGRYYLNLAKEQADRLTKVVTQLMNFQKADIGKEQLVLARIELVSLIQHRVIMFQSVATSHNIELKFSTSNSDCYAMVDESMIEKVVDNLVSNAIKYSKPCGVVEVKFSLQNHRWNLEVKDYGIGISKEANSKLFKEFYRGENAVNSKIVGSGIGLLISKKYISLHGGTINCYSQLNIGTSFMVSVPIKDNVIPWNIEEEEEEEEEEISSSGQAEGLLLEDNQDKSFSVLIVEDNDDLRNFLQETLHLEYNIVLASNGEEAWELIKDNLPNLIVSDIMMPKMDGFELCRLIKSTYETSHIPVILLTALSDKSQQMRGFGLGADAYLTKPFDTTLLKQRIQSIILNRVSIREKALMLVAGNVSEPILTNQLNDQFIKKALEVVKDNISNPEFNKDLFASEMNVSASLLYKKIKSLTDQSPSDFIKIIRMTNSLELLRTRKYTITEVSELSGFSSVGYYGTVFKKHFGKSPSEVLEV